MNSCKQIIEIPISTYSFLDTVVVLGIIGYELSTVKDKIKGNILIRGCSFTLFVLMNVLRFYAQKQLYQINESNGAYINWDSIFGIICATTFFVFLYSFDNNSWNKYIKKIIELISGRTFMVYLLHVIIYFKLSAFGVQVNVQQICSKYGKMGDLAYSIFYPILCFMFTFIASTIIAYCSKKIKK